MEGEALTDAMGFFFATLAVIPLVMTAVSLLVGARANRALNLIAGLAFGFFGVYAVTSHLLAGDFNGHVLMAALAAVLAFLIAGLGLAERRQPVSEAPSSAVEQGRPREHAGV